jgi:hypothetical protein
MGEGGRERRRNAPGSWRSEVSVAEMNETVTLQTLLIVGVPTGVVVLATLFVVAFAGTFGEAQRRLRGRPSPIAELERRVATLETALKRARASEMPLEIEAERLAEEIQLLGANQQRGATGATPFATPVVTPTATAAAPSEVGSSTTDEPAEESEPTESTAARDGATHDGATHDGAAYEAPAAEASSWSSEEAVASDEGEPGEEELEEEAHAIVYEELPPDPDETEEDRRAREQLEAEERERIEQLAAEEARIRQEREDAERRTRERIEAEAKRRREEQEARERAERERQEEEERRERERREEEERLERERLEAEAQRRQEEERLERERLEAEAQRRREEEQRRKAEEFRRRVADATPKLVMSAGGSNREAVTINIAVTNNLTPKRAEIAVLSASWQQQPAPATFEHQRKDGLYEERWPKQAKNGATPGWGTYQDTTGRVFECPEDAPTENQAWIVVSYERTAGGPASTWQRFEVGGAGALWYVRQPVGDPIVIEAKREAGEEAAA